LGLVGGSLARALTRKGYRVTGIDWPLVVRQALRSHAISRGATRAEAAARSRRANAVVRALVRDAGARVVLTDAARHDRVMAFLSHAPQVVAWALLDAARADPVARRQLRHAGPGFRGMTRLARSPRALWHDILGANRVEVTRALAALRRALERRRP